MASQWANRFRAWVLGDGAQDSGCGIKVFRKDAFLRLPYFDHMHRYMPALMRREGYGVEFVEVNHRPRKAGRSNYTNTGRLIAAMSDLWGVMWLKSRLRDPGGADEL
jgi:dolichol-phosphate mannosyltransferase